MLQVKDLLRSTVSNFDRALKFYTSIMTCLNIELRFCDKSRPWAGWHCADGARPYFVICKPFDGGAHDVGNGQMVAFLADDRQMVRECHLAALANGGIDEGAPGLRPEYHENYYGAYFRDTEGNKLCIACHESE